MVGPSQQSDSLPCYKPPARCNQVLPKLSMMRWYSFYTRKPSSVGRQGLSSLFLMMAVFVSSWPSCLRLAQPCASQAAYLGSATPGIRLPSSRGHHGDLSKVPCGIFFILEVLAGSRRGLCGENPWQGTEIRWSEPPRKVRVCVEDDAEGFWV